MRGADRSEDVAQAAVYFQQQRRLFRGLFADGGVAELFDDGGKGLFVCFRGIVRDGDRVLFKGDVQVLDSLGVGEVVREFLDAVLAVHAALEGNGADVLRFGGGIRLFGGGIPQLRFLRGSGFPDGFRLRGRILCDGGFRRCPVGHGCLGGDRFTDIGGLYGRLFGVGGLFLRSDRVLGDGDAGMGRGGQHQGKKEDKCFHII